MFADIIKIVTIFTKKVFKDSKKAKRIRNYASKCHQYCISWHSKIGWFPGENADVISKIQRVCHVIHILSLILNKKTLEYK